MGQFWPLAYGVHMTPGSSSTASLPASATTPTAAWSGLSLRLLEVTFEPATALAGELFDRLCEHLGQCLQQADLAARLGRVWTPSYLSLPMPSVAVRRTSAQQLREAVLAGSLPGNRASQRQAAATVRTIAQDAQRLEVPMVLTQVLDHLAKALARYAQAGVRLREQVMRTSTSRENCADLALRAERTLLTALEEDIGQFTLA